MSKQLLHACGSNAVVIGLNDRAFALIKKNDNVSALILELLPPTSKLVLKEKKDDGIVGEDITENTKNGKGGDDDENDEDIPDDANVDTTKLNNPLEIQAVCCSMTNIENEVYFAVSRENKTLSLYSYTMGISLDDNKSSLIPNITYNMPRRARCLAYTVVDDTNLIVIAGDMSGDTIAYPVVPQSTSTRRLLLGHTASILTGLNVVSGLLLTADRDEKVRVSAFPDTQLIRGYLLGHTSFISTMDVVVSTTTDRTLGVTGSGDGSVRLWDCASCHEIGIVPAVAMIKKDVDEVDGGKTNSNEEDRDKEDEKILEGDDDDKDDDDNDNEDSHHVAVPLSVALTHDTESIIVVRDGLNTINVHSIPTFSDSHYFYHNVNKFLNQKQTIACPLQPLFVRCLHDGSFLILVSAPYFLLHYRCIEGGDGTYVDVSFTSPFCKSLRGFISCSEGCIIDMPSSTLERDENGGHKLGKARLHFDKHWNDVGRKEVAKLALQRRKKRRIEEAKKVRMKQAGGGIVGST
jgi:tRNA (guanine-N(7)-)-methyltransferase subunit TRM82